MAYDEGLAERVRDMLRSHPNVSERAMFGGLAFMLDGHMAVGVIADTLMARVGPHAYEQALTRRHVRKMDFTGRPMKGYVFVDAPGLERDADLGEWVERCARFVATLPRKTKK